MDIKYVPLLSTCRICTRTPIDSRDAFPLASSLLCVMSDKGEVDLATGGRAERKNERARVIFHYTVLIVLCEYGRVRSEAWQHTWHWENSEEESSVKSNGKEGQSLLPLAVQTAGDI